MATANDVLNVMRSWLGFNESNGKFKQIIDLYNSVKPLPRGYAVKYTDEWCDTCVSAAGIKAGAESLIGRECGVEKHVDIFKSKGIWIEDGSITPQPGDIIVFNWDDNTQPNDGYSDHIGYVETVSNGVITTIEGNTSQSVARRTYKVGHGNIRGFARPKYSEGSSSTETPSSDIDSLARDVIAGKFGNGQARKDALGSKYDAVQKRVNEILNGSTSSSVDIDDLARRTIRGEFGNGEARKKALGANYDAVQKRVNELL